MRKVNGAEGVNRPRARRCEHAEAYAVAAEQDGEMHSAGVVCRACGAVRFCPIVLGIWTSWSPPLEKQAMSFPDGVALRILAGPSRDADELEMAACDAEAGVVRP
jgi:hypothetical protein